MDGPRGKVVRFKVTERKRIQIVDFRGSKDLTTSNIEDALKKADAQIKIDTFYDPAKARKVETIIKEMLAEKGRPFGTVKHEAKNIGGSGQQLSFIIDDGPKAKVHEIVFDGNQVFPDKKLAGKMKKIKTARPHNLSWLGGKTTYTEDKWLGGEEDPRGDRGRLEDFYLDHGYVTARVGQPKITYTDGKPGWFKKKPVKLMRLEIPVTEGEQYRMGELKFEGLTVLKEDFVRGYFKMVPGDVYNDSKFKKAYEKLRDVYGSLGYFQWTGGTQRKPDPEKKVVDITVKMEEDKQYFLGRINFTGNDSDAGQGHPPRDLHERGRGVQHRGPQDVDQAGQPARLLQADGGRARHPPERDRGQQGRRHLQGRGAEPQPVHLRRRGLGLRGGVPERELLDHELPRGRRDGERGGPDRQPHEELLVLRERALLPRPPHHRRSQRLPQPDHVPLLRDDGRGVRAADPGSRAHLRDLRRPFLARVRELLLPDHRHLRRGPGHGLPPQRLDVRDRQRAHGSGSALTAIDADYFGGTGRRFESGISPSYVRNTVDNPFTPRAGSRYTASFQFVGGPLQGTVNYMRPTIELVRYQPFGRRMALGVRGEAAYIRPFGDTTTIPYYQRYFLGGETQIRGYNVRSVAPYDAVTKTSVGGDKFLLFNAEYYFDVFGPLRLLLFFDAGQAYAPGQGFYWKTMSTSTGVEARFIMPVLNVPFRLIYAWNPNRDFYQPPHAFKFAVGTTF